jgi:hypothetical protein
MHVNTSNKIENEYKNNRDDISSFADLYRYLQKYEGDLIDWLKEPWEGKDKQESLLRLFANLGIIEKLQGYMMCRGNFNMKTIEKIESTKQVFYNELNDEIMLKDKGDSSDLTGIHITKHKHLLVTSSKNKNKLLVGGLDIDPILRSFQQYKEDGYTMTLCICIRNKSDYDKMVHGIESSNKELRDILNKEDTIVIDWNDLRQSYQSFKKNFHKGLDTIVAYNKSPLLLKMHQRLSILKTMNMKQNGETKILWGHIQRSGKSYIIAGCIIEDSSNKEKCNYLIITTAPNETVDQYLKVFDCMQLQNFNIIYLNNKTKKPNITDRNIIVCSKQFLQSKIGLSNEEIAINIPWLKRMVFDMRFIDESHNGGTTKLAKKTLEYYGNNSFTVQITATYTKPIHDYCIPRENWILWDLEDIKLCKNISADASIRRLTQKHGNILNVIKEYSPQSIIDEYSKYPELWILTDEIKSDVISEINSQTTDNNYGWSSEACFLLKQGIDNGIRIVKEEFQNESEMLKVWYRIFGKKNRLGIPDKDYPDSIVFMKRIEKICKNPIVNSRFISESNTNSPMVVMAFLPQNDIEQTSNATRNLLQKYNVIPNFEIVCINSKTTNNPKQAIEDARSRAINSSKNGVLVLSGRQCSLGVSIDNCDIVLLLNNNSSFDMIHQMMFRCMTEGTGKKCGFVVDLNIHRVIDAYVMSYATLIQPDVHPKEAIQYILHERLINLNGDHWMPCFGNDKLNISQLSTMVYDIYSSKTEKALESFIDRLRLKNVLLSKDDQHIFNVLFNVNKPTVRQIEQISRLIDNGDNNDNGDNHIIKKGIEKTSVASNGTSSDEVVEIEDISEDNKCKYMDILTHIVPLICILTIHASETSFVEMYNYINQDQYTYKILIDQTKSWWGRHIDNVVLKKFIDVYNKYVKNDNETNQIIRIIKELFTKNIHNSKVLSSLVDKYLIPQELEKKNNAEVSTPLCLRTKMLDTVPIDFWKTPHKVFEPCSGKGGFLLDIIDRFMEGLSDIIPDKKERYRVIVEECLYWSDINSTNVFIGRLLIDPFNEYKLNYNESDTLELNIINKWNVENFDLIVGNPPYQPPSNNKKGGKSLWDTFVRFSIRILKQNGLLLFVHPALWRKPENSMIDIMFNKQIHYLSIHNKVEGKKIFGATTRYDYYLLENIEPYTESVIRFEDNKTHKVIINKLPFIPNFGWSIFEKVMRKLNNDGIIVIRDSDCHTSRDYVNQNETPKFKFQLLNSISNTNGKTYCYSSRPHKNQYVKKVIFSNGETIVPFYDNGELGVTEGGLYSIVVSEDDGHNLVKYLNTKLIKFIIKATKWSNFETSKQIFQYIPNISTTTQITDENVYKFFELTKDDINQIENNIVNKQSN